MLDFEKIMNKYEEDCFKDDYDVDNIINYNNAKHRKLFLNEIDDGVGTAIDAMIRFYNQVDDDANIPVEEREPIKIYIDSPGGNLSDTFTIVDAITMSKTPVWGIVTGMACSGGFFSLLACHKRMGYKHSTFLYHEGAVGNSGTAGQFQNFTQYYLKQLEMLKELVIEKTNYTEETYKDIKKDDVWYTSNEALDLGIIDEIIEELV